MSQLPTKTREVLNLFVRGHYKYCNKNNRPLQTKKLAIILGVSITTILKTARQLKLKTPRVRKAVRYKIDKKTNCWIWLLADKNGYGSLRINKRQVLAHVYYYELVHGKIPHGLELDHLCKNPLCINVEHLEAVTHIENIRRGRHCKINIDSAMLIRKLNKIGGWNIYALGKKFKLHSSNIARILRNELWKLEGVNYMAIKASDFNDKDFTIAYFQGATDANEMQRKLVADNVTDLNALQLSANLLKWLREAEGDNTKAKQQETDAKMRDINSQIESARSSNLTSEGEGGDNTSKESSMSNQASSKTAQSPQSSSGLLANAPTPSK